MTSDAREDDVLNFYRDPTFQLPFEREAAGGRNSSFEPVRTYPPLIEKLRSRPRLLDLGSGTGWLVNAAAFHHRCPARGNRL